MDPELLSLLQSMSPEELQQLMGMGTLDERGDLAATQLARADALRNRPTAQRATLGGAIGEGIGGLSNTIAGGLKANAAMEQMRGLLGQKDSGRSLYADLLRRMKGPAQPQGAGTLGMGDLMPDDSGGLLG